MLIIHAHLHTMAGADIADGYLRTEGNQIAELGGMPVEPKPGEEVIDAQGAGLYPGFVDAHTHLGMWEDGLTFEGTTATKRPTLSRRSCGQSTPSTRWTAVSRRRCMPVSPRW